MTVTMYPTISGNVLTSTLSFHVDSKEAVNKLTIDFIKAGFDVLYEPHYQQNIYESSVLISEQMVVKILYTENTAIREVTR